MFSRGTISEDENDASVSPVACTYSSPTASSLASSPRLNHRSRLLAIVVVACDGFALRGAGAAALAPPPVPWASRPWHGSALTTPKQHATGVVCRGRARDGAFLFSSSSSALRLWSVASAYFQSPWSRDRGDRLDTKWSPPMTHRFHLIGPRGGVGGNRACPVGVLRAVAGGGGGSSFSEDPFDDLAHGNSASDGYEDEEGEGGDVAPTDADDDEGGGGPVFYDDFGDFSVGGGGGGLIGGEGSDDSMASPSASGGGALDLEALTSRVKEQLAQSVRRDARLARNWSSGNWAVRGFALDSFDAAEDLDLGRPPSEEETGRRIGGSTAATGEWPGGGGTRTITTGDPEEDVTLPSGPTWGEGPEESARSSPPPRGRIHVSKIALDLDSVALPGGADEEAEDDRDAVLAVGRTDGSCVVVRLGGEYLTRFRSVPELTFEEVEPAGDEENGKNDDGGGGEVDDSSSESSVVARVGSRLVRSDDLREDRGAGSTLGKFDDGPITEKSATAAAGSTSTNDNRPYNDGEEGGSAPPTPFEILHQFQAIRPATPRNKGDDDAAADVAVTSLLLDGRDLFASGGRSGRVEHWRLPAPGAGVADEDDNAVVPGVEHVRTLEAGARGGDVVAIRALASPSSAEEDDDDEEEERDLILTVVRGGTFSLWDRRATTGAGGDEPIATVVVRDGRNETVSGILSADIVTMPPADGGGTRTLIFLGLETGHVQGYALRDVLDSCGAGPGGGGSMMAGNAADVVVVPACRFLAHGDAGAPGVTALAWAGAGTLTPSMGSPSSSRGSSILLTGGADGIVKQWEIFARGGGGGGDDPPGTTVRLEHWPRLGTQRMRRRAHVLTGTRHDGGVTAVAGDAARVLSCGADGRVVAWSPSTGERMYVMDGFTGDISSLCVGRTLLVTDGMDGYVCLHDFDTSESLDDAYDTEED